MNIAKYILLFSVAGICLSFDTGDDKAASREMVGRIKNEAFEHSKVMETLFEMTDVNGPRLTGSRGMKKAEAWAKQKLEGWGLSNVAIEPWGSFGKGWETKKCYIAMTAPYYQQLIAVPKAWTPGTNGLVNAEVAVLKAEEEEDLNEYKGTLSGKVVIVLTSNPSGHKAGFEPDAKRLTDEELSKMTNDPHLNDNPPAVLENKNKTDRRKSVASLRKSIGEFLMHEGAVAVLSGRRGTMGTLFTSNGASYKLNSDDVLPELEMGTEHIDRMIRLKEAGKDVRVEIDVQNEFNLTDSIEYNVVAEIPGSDKNLKNQLVMLGAHLDSWHGSTGATDNGAGSAVMMEVMRILKALNVRPRRTIRLVLWSGEEQGLLGSKGYVHQHFGSVQEKNIKPEQGLVSAYFNLDNGAGKIRGIYLQQNEAVRPYFEKWFEPFHDLGAQTITIRNTGGTDHLAFDAVGIPGFQFIQDPLEYGSRTHHTNMDSYDRVIPADLQQAAAVIASFVYNTAMLDEQLPRKAMRQE